MSTPSPKLEALAGLIEQHGADPKPTMLRVLTDFYTQKSLHTPEEDRHFTELALRLIADVDADTRADISRRLTKHGNAPAIVLRRLGENETAAADTLRFKGSTSERASPVAATLPVAAIDSADRLAAANFSENFFTCDSAGRRTMLRDLDSGTVKLSGLKSEAAAASCRTLESAALRSRPFEFVREMESALGLSRKIAQKIVNDTSGEPMLVVAKALAMPVDVLQRVLLLVNPAVGTSVRRVFDLTELYHAMSEQSALRMIALWRYAGEPEDSSTSTTRDNVARRAPADTGRTHTNPITVDPVKRDQRAS